MCCTSDSQSAAQASPGPLPDLVAAVLHSLGTSRKQNTIFASSSSASSLRKPRRTFKACSEASHTRIDGEPNLRKNLQD